MTKFEELIAKATDKHAVIALCNDRGIVKQFYASVFWLDGKLYFQTDRNSHGGALDYKTTIISVAMNGITFKGVLQMVGRPDEHPDIYDKYKQAHPNSAKRYGHLPGERIYRFKPIIVSSFFYENDEPRIIYAVKNSYKIITGDTRKVLINRKEDRDAE